MHAGAYRQAKKEKMNLENFNPLEREELEEQVKRISYSWDYIAAPRKYKVFCDAEAEPGKQNSAGRIWLANKNQVLKTDG
jgi:hypothetical protein